MCGVVGAIAQRNVVPILLEGLRRLEYRGYDSAGIATLVAGRIERRRAPGKLDRLAARLPFLRRRTELVAAIRRIYKIQIRLEWVTDGYGWITLVAPILVAARALGIRVIDVRDEAAAVFAADAAARLTGTEAPVMADTEASFAELKERCAKTIAYLESVDPAAYDAGLDREVVITFPNGAGLRFDGATFLNGFAVPNFYFHLSHTYAILRHNGVPLGKRDYLGALSQREP